MKYAHYALCMRTPMLLCSCTFMRNYLGAVFIITNPGIQLTFLWNDVHGLYHPKCSYTGHNYNHIRLNVKDFASGCEIKLPYKVTFDNINTIINSSAECRQYAKWVCYGSSSKKMYCSDIYWTNKDDEKGSGHDPEKHELPIRSIVVRQTGQLVPRHHCFLLGAQTIQRACYLNRMMIIIIRRRLNFIWYSVAFITVRGASQHIMLWIISLLLGILR